MEKTVVDTVFDELYDLGVKRREYYSFLSGVIRGAGELSFTPRGFSVSIKHTEQRLIRLIENVVKDLYSYDVTADFSRMNLGYKEGFFYTLVIPAEISSDLLEKCGVVTRKYEFIDVLPPKLVGSKATKKAFLRGLFLSCGFLKIPESQSGGGVSQGYTLSFNLNSDIVKEKIVTLIEQECLLEPGTVKRKKKGSGIYIKSSEAICGILTFLGSVKGSLLLYDVISARQLRNDVNRVNNFDLANLDKSVVAGARQIDAITRIKNSGSYSKLSDELKKICDIRCEFPDVSLEELRMKLQPPISKSCLNHRLRRIVEIAESLNE